MKTRWAGVLAGLAVVMVPLGVAAEPLKGSLTDAVTGVGIAGATVRVLGTHHEVKTDALGRWAFELPRGVYEVELSAVVDGEVQVSRLVRQYVPQIKGAEAYVFTTRFYEQGVPARAEPVGLPAGSGHAPVGSPDSLPIVAPEAASSVLDLTIPGSIPRRIRVGRRERPTEGCSNNPVIAIEEMDLDEYVRGVLPPEIGVFRNIPGASEVYKTFALAAKSYGLWFMLYYSGDRQRTTAPLPPNNYDWFHIDDTACNQRYSDQRLTITTQAADAVLNKLLTKRGNTSSLDKYEYAASCGKHGTQPEHQSALVPDQPSVSSCVGSWCGHNSCAGHADNPDVPGSDRCLVRGICQWGAASWGEAGKDYLWMVQHYQPNLQITDLTATPLPRAVTLTGYVYTDPSDITGTGVGGVSVQLSDGQSAVTSAAGVFQFEAVALDQGTVTLTASKPGYLDASRDKELVEGTTNWASFQLSVDEDYMPDMGAPPADMGQPEDMASAQDMGAAPVDMSAGQDMASAQDMGADAGGLSKLGPLLSTSPGIDGGCACRQAPGRPGGALGVVALGLGLCALRRRPRR